MGNAQRTGLQATATSLNSSTVGALTLRWSYLIGDQTTSSPVTANGIVYVATGGGAVVAFDERTGNPIWRRQLGGPITMTPTVDSGILFVATHAPPAHFFALDAETGATRWQTSLPGAMRGEPLALGGVVYVPEAGGDPGFCYQGGIYAYAELTGTLEWTWFVNPLPSDGGSVWSPISYDGRDLVFGTGNACSEDVTNANSVVQLTLGGQQEWLTPQIVNSYVDDDWGGGAMISGTHVFATNKNGKFYSLNDQNGTIAWTKTLSTLDGDGSIGSPATNGTVIIVPSGFVTDPQTDPTAFVGAYDFNGNLLWQVPTHDIVSGGATLTNDVAFVSIDSTVQALAISSGASLWTFDSAAGVYFYASPAVDSTGLYAVDTSGSVYAFSVGTSYTASRVDRAPARARAVQAKAPFGSILRKTPGGAVRARY